MKRSLKRILTTHAGSLPRPGDLRELYRSGAPADKLASRLRSAVTDVVRHQIDAGLDVVNDGEFGKPMSEAIDYGAWATYVFQRLSGFEMREVPPDSNVFQQIMGRSKDRLSFADFYASDEIGIPRSGGLTRLPVNTGPIGYAGQAIVQRDIENLRSAISGKAVEEAFMTAAVTSVQIVPSEYYKTGEEEAIAVAEAMRQEYKAITDAGLNVQLDDPIIVNVYEWQYSVSGDLAAFRKWAAAHVEMVNHALEGIPEDRVRYHLCWGSWKGPHSTDLPLRDVIDLVLKVKASQYSVEAANPQHEHEWKVWKDVKLPEGKAVVPGIVTHKTNVLEHPHVVADRIIRYADVVGRENVIAGSDCGFGGRMNSQLAWAKLETLAQGAALASKELWP